MPNKMLIDATHPEETRVVVVRGNRVEEFDFESAQRKQLRGNIYLAKVTRVEPSLQAAFVDYGGNRHGFLAFSEIHPDYYQIPVADRQALIEDEERAQKEAEAESENRSNRRRSRHRHARRRGHGERVQSAVVDNTTEADAPQLDAAQVEFAASEADLPVESIANHHQDGEEPSEYGHDEQDHQPVGETEAHSVSEFHTDDASHDAPLGEGEAAAGHDEHAHDDHEHHEHDDHAHDHEHGDDGHHDHEAHDDEHHHDSDEGHIVEVQSSDEQLETSEDAGEDDDSDEDAAEAEEEEQVESVGGDDALEEMPERAFRPRRQYKIQEVIKRRQVMLVQVVKEERGNKGAALTTYLSLAGRYAVLMPNTARGGGISRKITSAQDRTRLKDVVQDLDVPEGMGIILRTAGASRSKIEIQRDFEYLLRLWETVRDLTLKSTAPALVYEEGSLIKRSIRDLYNKDIDEVLVAGEAAHTEAREFMNMLMPGQGRSVKLYRDPQPLFSRMGVESQLDAMFSQTVQLRSGGYIVLNQTEALVAIDVNSGRATREHHIEDTALKTNLEAAEEVARQLRLRDLAGLVVIDFIDMDEKRNNRSVERKLSECLRHDRARIQVGRISHFGLLEMSRQRIRASMLESSTEPCPHCGGLGHVRSISSAALQLLRGVEESLMKGATHNLIVRTRPDVALYVLNHKRGHLRDLESGFKVTITVMADEALSGPQPYIVERGEMVHTPEAARANLAAQTSLAPAAPEDEDEDEFEDVAEGDEEGSIEVAAEEAEGAGTTEQEGGRRKRRRRRRGRGRGGENREQGGTPQPSFAGDQPQDFTGDQPFEISANDASESDDDEEASTESEASQETSEDAQASSGDRRPRRRGRRGGRRRRGNFEEGSVGAISDDLRPESSSDVADAVADLDRPSARPFVEEQPAVSAPQPEPFAPAPVTQHQDEAHQEQPTRRRSTVREPVPFLSGAPTSETPAQPQATPAPAAHSEPSTPEPAPTDGPRKAGWWSRRFGGG